MEPARRDFFSPEIRTGMCHSETCCGRLFRTSDRIAKVFTVIEVIAVATFPFDIVDTVNSIKENGLSFFNKGAADLSQTIGEAVILIGVGIGLTTYYFKVVRRRNREYQRLVSEETPLIDHYSTSITRFRTERDINGFILQDASMKKLILSNLKIINHKFFPLEEWLKVKDYKDINAAANALYKQLPSGVCYGFTMALLSLMPTHSKCECDELIDKVNIEKIVYFQTLQSILVDYSNNSKLREILIRFVSRPAIEITKKDTMDDLFFKILGLQTRSQLGYFHTGLKLISVATLSTTLYELFFEGYRAFQDRYAGLAGSSSDVRPTLPSSMEDFKNLSEYSLAGGIHLHEMNEDITDGKEKFDHELFWQISSGNEADELICRFHDSGCTLAGFYRFSDPESFIEGLANHIIHAWPKYANGAVKITYAFIPLATT